MCSGYIHIHTHKLNIKEPRYTKCHMLVSLPGAGDDIETNVNYLNIISCRLIHKNNCKVNRGQLLQDHSIEF